MAKKKRSTLRLVPAAPATDPRSQRQRKEERRAKKVEKANRRAMSSKPPKAVVLVDDATVVTEEAPATDRSPETIRPTPAEAMPGAPSFKLQEMVSELPPPKTIVLTPAPEPPVVERKTTPAPPPPPPAGQWQGPVLAVGGIALLATIVGAMFYVPTPAPKNSHDVVVAPTTETRSGETEVDAPKSVQEESEATPKVAEAPAMEQPSRVSTTSAAAPTPWEPPITMAERAGALQNATETLQHETPPELVRLAHGALLVGVWPQLRNKPQQDAARIAFAMVTEKRINFSTVADLEAAITAFTGRPKPNPTLMDEGPTLVH